MKTAKELIDSHLEEAESDDARKLRKMRPTISKISGGLGSLADKLDKAGHSDLKKKAMSILGDLSSLIQDIETTATVLNKKAK